MSNIVGGPILRYFSSRFVKEFSKKFTLNYIKWIAPNFSYHALVKKFKKLFNTNSLPGLKSQKRVGVTDSVPSTLPAQR